MIDQRQKHLSTYTEQSRWLTSTSVSKMKNIVKIVQVATPTNARCTDIIQFIIYLVAFLLRTLRSFTYATALFIKYSHILCQPVSKEGAASCMSQACWHKLADIKCRSVCLSVAVTGHRLITVEAVDNAIRWRYYSAESVSSVFSRWTNMSSLQC